ncbi:1-aminocyclopropane-1-carboxylate deaminase/D-cysteine desulfhydrase [Catenulispora yoronensis]
MTTPELILRFDSNKPRKLKYNLAAAREEGASTLLTFGGAYSNHIRAVAAAGKTEGFKTIGIIRGEEHLPLNDSLAFAVSQGMDLHYMDRQTYRTKRADAMRRHLEDLFGSFFLIPEGGSNPHAVRGCAELPGEIAEPFDVICCPVGTGAPSPGSPPGSGPSSGRSVSRRCGAATSGTRSRRSRTRPTARSSTTGTSRTTSIAAATRRSPRNSTISPRSSARTMGSTWSGSTSRRCSTASPR